MSEKPEQKANEFCDDNCLEKRIEKLENQVWNLKLIVDDLYEKMEGMYE